HTHSEDCLTTSMFHGPHPNGIGEPGLAVPRPGPTTESTGSLMDRIYIMHGQIKAPACFKFDLLSLKDNDIKVPSYVQTLCIYHDQVQGPAR
ncbi:Uncharacterized protein DAT39_013972, partial [Clarias magur]